MNAYPQLLKHKLLSLIHEMAMEPEPFVCNPGRDFTRNRKLDFETLFKCIIGMGGANLRHELYKYFDYDLSTASTSAFCQQRCKLNDLAFKHLFNSFTSTTSKTKLYKGYRLLAIDGSSLNIHHAPECPDTYILHSGNAKGYSALHMNALFDLENKLYMDLLVQHQKVMNEYTAACEMIDRSSISSDAIVIADRGYESYNVFAHIIEKGWKFLIRAKDLSSNGISKALNLPDLEEFDELITVQLTTSKSKKMQERLKYYKRLRSNKTFDYIKSSGDVYELRFRAIRFRNYDGNYIMLFTNLDSKDFTPLQVRELYNMRWGIETSFRELKHAIGLTSFHSKKVEFVLQEIYARVLMYNFCEMITLQVVLNQKNRKHSYQVNFTAAIDFCKRLFCTKENEHPPDVEALIQKNILPIRKGRKFPRLVGRGKTVSFIYRVS